MHKIIRYAPAFLFFTFISYLIFLADIDEENFIMSVGHAFKYGDKVGHFMLFGLMALLLNSAFNFRTIEFKNKSFYISSIIVLSFGLLEELSQLAFESRTFDLIDLVFDYLGVQFFSQKVIINLYRKSKNYVLVKVPNHFK